MDTCQSLWGSHVTEVPVTDRKFVSSEDVVFQLTKKAATELSTWAICSLLF